MNEAPARRVGGSDIAKLLGVSKYGNAADVYLRIVEGLEDEWNPRMQRGAAMEPALRAYGQNALQLELEDAESDVHISREHDFAWAQVDDIAGWRGMPVVVDYKTQSAFAKGWGAEGSADVPELYDAQIRWEMLCADRPLGLLVVGFGEDVPPPEIFHLNNVVTYQVERDGVWESHAVSVARDFWATHILPRCAPAMKPIGKKKVKRHE